MVNLVARNLVRVTAPLFKVAEGLSGALHADRPVVPELSLEREISKLGEHVRQEVQLTGKESGSSNTSMSDSHLQKLSSESLKFNMSKVKKISDTCTSANK